MRWATIYLPWWLLAFNVGLLVGNAYAHRWWFAAWHAALGLFALYLILVNSRLRRLNGYLDTLIERCKRVSLEHIGEEPIEEMQARLLAMGQVVDRSYRNARRKPWGPVEEAARDLELFGVPIAEGETESEIRERQ